MWLYSNRNYWTRMMCLRYIKTLGLSLLPFLWYACAQDDVLPLGNEVEQSITESIPLGKPALLRLEGELVEDEVRSFALELKDGANYKIPQLALDKETYPITLYIRKLGNPAITSVSATAKVHTVEDTGKKRIHVTVEKFTLQGAGQRFVKGESGWYISGLIGSAPASRDEQGLFLTSDVERPLPLGFPWMPLNIKEEGFGEHLALNFNMIGNLLRVGLRNNIVAPVEVIKIKLNSREMAFSGSFAPEQTTDDDLRGAKYLRFASSTLGRDYEFHVSEEAKRGLGLRIDAGYETMLRNGLAFLWVYPMQANANIQAQMEVVTRPMGFTAEQLNASDLPEAEKKSFLRYSVPTLLRAPSGGYRHSYIHKAPLTISSDLMITEVYHFAKGNLNTSIIELHNPTLDPIELRHYGLMKVGEDKAGTVNTNYVAFYPQTDQTVAERGVDTSDKSGGYKEARLTQALIMPLDLVKGDDAELDYAYWRWRTYEPLLRDGNNPNKSKYFEHRVKTRRLRTGVASGDGLTDLPGGFLPMPSGINPVLDPGKTMLILGPGYVEYTPDESGYGLLYPTAAGITASGGALQEGQLGPGIQPIEACRKGYCQWAFAMADYAVEGAATFQKEASTNQLGKDQGVVLVKQRRDLIKHPDLQNGMERKVVDCSHPWNNAGSAQDEIRDRYPQGSTNTYFRVRCDGDYFPSPFYNINNWHFENMEWSNKARGYWKSREYYTKRATLGTRSFVQDGTKANQSNWGATYVAPRKRW